METVPPSQTLQELAIDQGIPWWRTIFYVERDKEGAARSDQGMYSTPFLYILHSRVLSTAIR